MTFPDFIEKSKKDILAFEAYWKAMQKKKPAHFPDEAMEGDWLEQFLIFQESEDRKVRP